MFKKKGFNIESNKDFQENQRKKFKFHAHGTNPIALKFCKEC
jgi:hypothetical protein